MQVLLSSDTTAVVGIKATDELSGVWRYDVIADIVAVTGYMAGTSSNITLATADVNGDGQVGIADIVAITDIMTGTANINSRQNARYKTYFVKRKE